MMKRQLGLRIVLLLLSMGLFIGVRAQTSTVGNISGTVRDPQGASLPQAEVIIEGENTGFSRTVRADDNGFYSAPRLPVGKYTVTATVSGFKKTVRGGVDVHVNEDLVVDLDMTIGDVSETVTVQSDEQVVETRSGEISSLVSEKQVSQLPLNGRNFAQLVLTVPGVSPGTFRTGGTGLDSSIDFSANGNGSAENLWTVDGVNNMDVGSNETLLVFPSIDSIEEFRVERNSFGVEFGQAQGAVVNVVTKGGGNTFHGAAWEFLRNDALNANDFLLNTAGQPRPKLRYNNYGFNVSGPVVLPRFGEGGKSVWNGKNKLFFFWSEEWRQERRGTAQTGHVPTAQEKMGDFSGPLTSDQAPIDPLTGQPFPGNRIPADRLSPAGLALMKLYPDPNNLQDLTGTNWVGAQTSPTNTRQDLIRGDWNVNSNMNVMVRFINENWARGAPALEWGDDPFPQVDTDWAQPSKSFVVKLTNTISATAVNDFQFSRSGNDITSVPSGGSEAFIADVNTTFPTVFPHPDGIAHPIIGWDPGSYTTLWTHGPWSNTEDLMVWKDDFSKVVGSHTVKAGALFSSNKKEEDGDIPNASVPEIDMGDFQTGNFVGDVLLRGTLIPSYVEFDHTERVKLRWHDIEFYLGDTWKMSKNVTLTYGLRWSRYGNAYAADDRITNFIPRLYDGQDPNSGLVQAGTRGFNRSLVETYNRGFQPRIGIAWDITGDGKTALRLGAGRYLSRTNITKWLTLGANPPWTRAVVLNDLRTFDEIPPGLDLDQLALTSSTFNAINEKMPPPESWQWNLTLSRQIWGSTVVEVSYVGNRGLHLWRTYNYNDIVPSARAAVAEARANDDPGLDDLINASRRLPGLGDINMNEDTGNSSYHSLQVWANRRFTNRLAFSAAYTWSHAITDVPLQAFVSSTTDAFNFKADRGSADLDRRHMFIATVVYELPAFKRWGSLGSHVLGGWQLNLIATFLSGLPIDVQAGEDTVGLVGDPGERPDLVPGQPIYLTGADRVQYLNPAAFAVPPLGRFGDLGRGVIRGPGSQNWDMSFNKNWQIRERYGLQFRAEMFNIFNHPIFNSVDNILSSGTFGQLSRDPSASNYRTPREIQFGLKLNF
jgi:hypothetical protein